MAEETIATAPAQHRSGWVFRLGRFHRNEKGDEGVNKILIIALIVVPLVIIIMIFGRKIASWFGSASNNMTSEQGNGIE